MIQEEYFQPSHLKDWPCPLGPCLSLCYLCHWHTLKIVAIISSWFSYSNSSSRLLFSPQPSCFHDIMPVLEMLPLGQALFVLRSVIHSVEIGKSKQHRVKPQHRIPVTAVHVWVKFWNFEREVASFHTVPWPWEV